MAAAANFSSSFVVVGVQTVSVNYQVMQMSAKPQDVAEEF